MEVIKQNCSSQPINQLNIAKPPSKQPTTNKNSYFDAFTFNDRISNRRYLHKEARQTIAESTDLNHTNCTFQQPLNKSMLSNNVRQLRFTRKFQANCIRNKYLVKTNHTEMNNSITQSKNNHEPFQPHFKNTKKHLSHKQLFQLNKMQFSRALQENDNISKEILQLNGIYKQLKSDNKRIKKDHNSKSNELFYVPKEQVRNTRHDEVAKRVNEMLVCHMKSEMQNNGQYLLDIDYDKRKKLLVKSQMKKNKTKNKYIFNVANQSKLRPFDEIKSTEFASIPRKNSEIEPSRQAQFLQKVRLGYIHEVQMDLRNNVVLCESTDRNNNNVFHVCAKTGNEIMMNTLFNLIPVKTCLPLLQATNNLKRKPVDKANILANIHIRSGIQAFKTQHLKR